MSENNNSGKKNFFKKLSGFKKFLVIYASALVVIIAVALVLLYGLLKDYEAGRPILWISLYHILKQGM